MRELRHSFVMGSLLLSSPTHHGCSIRLRAVSSGRDVLGISSDVSRTLEFTLKKGELTADIVSVYCCFNSLMVVEDRPEASS